MSVEKILLKSDCKITKSSNQINIEFKKKYFYIIVFVLLVVTSSVCFFVQYTLVRINQVEDELRRTKETFEDLLELHKEMNRIINPTTSVSKPYDFADNKDDDEDYYDYLDFNWDDILDREYESATHLTKDDKDVTEVPGMKANIRAYNNVEKQVSKRSIVAATKDGVFIHSEPYSEMKTKNPTFDHDRYKGKSVTPLPARSSYFGDPSNLKFDGDDLEAVKPIEDSVTSSRKTSVSARSSRIMRREVPTKAFRRLIKKPQLKSGDMDYDTFFRSEEVPTTPETILVNDSSFGTRRKLARSRPLITIHFSGDTSKYVFGQHDNYKGNGHLRHPHRNFVDWAPSEWVRKTGMDSHFSIDQGILTIKESGLYFVYAQIYYLDEHDTTGYRVFKNSDMILQCTITQHSPERKMKGNTCYTAGVEFLSASDTLYLSDITPGKYSLFEAGKSFFGLIKLGDFRNN